MVSEVGLSASMADPVDRGTRLERVRLQSETAQHQRWEVRYPVDGLEVTGILLVPAGDGPFPAVVLNHGYIDRDTYWSGQGLPREQERLVAEGYVVLHTDYRGHAGSDDVDELDHTLRVGYSRDALAAAAALGNEPDVDHDRVAMLGRSMGGAVTLSAAVTEPELVAAVVLYASVSSRFEDNFERWDVTSRPAAAQALGEQIGEPEEAPQVWDDLSPRSYLDRLATAATPVLMHHGELDESCPVAWAETTEDELERADVDVTAYYYEAEGHTFEAGWEQSMQRTLDFLDDTLG